MSGYWAGLGCFLIFMFFVVSWKHDEFEKECHKTGGYVQSVTGGTGYVCLPNNKKEE